MNFECKSTFNPWTYIQIHTPPYKVGGGGGLIKTLPRIFDMLEFFETILPLEESFWSSQQDGVY